ncbi:hypothetical protein [Sansalvadorimonas verongulae]|nr:hypothetical protein [Sansalvadorimonas verongulae]
MAAFVDGEMIGLDKTPVAPINVTGKGLVPCVGALMFGEIA